MSKRYSYLFMAVVILTAIAIRFVLSYLSINNLPASSDESIAQLLAQKIASGEQFPLLFTGQPYQFPIEAYYMSLFVDFFGNNALAARLPLILVSIVTLITLCYVNVLALSEKNRWPTYLLLLIPSAYWLLHQSAYFVPQYTASALLSALLFLTAIKSNQAQGQTGFITLVCGFLAGLSLSNHLLTLSVVAGAFMITAFSGTFRQSLRRVIVFGLGFSLGLLPFILAVLFIDGSYVVIASRVDIGVLFIKLYQMVINQVLPGAMGVYPPYFPDYPVHISWGTPLRSLFLAGFLIILGVSIAIRGFAFFKSIYLKVWPRLSWPDMFIIISISAIILMASNARTHSAEHRYLLPVVWSFPFLAGYLYSISRSWLRWLLVGFITFLLLINLVTTVELFKEWAQPEKIQHHADTADVSKVIDWLESQDIHYCYGTFWLSYRITYETDKRITCAPIYNERFNGWPIPYKDRVDQQEKVAYIMSNTYGTKFSSRKFERLLDQYEVRYQREWFDPYFVYYDFEYLKGSGEKLLAPDLLKATTTITSLDASILTDGDVMQAWPMEVNQDAGQAITVLMDRKHLVQRVDIIHPLIKPVPAKAVKLLGHTGNGWVPLTGVVELAIDRLRFDNQHPIFGEFLQTIRFEPTMIDAIKIELIDPEQTSSWTLSEIRIAIQTNVVEMK